jgi:hypothetical protein
VATSVVGAQMPPDMEEVKKPELLRFKTGTVVDGILLRMDRLNVQGKPGLKWTVLQTDDVMVAFWGTADLNERLSPRLLGHRVYIKCEGEDQMVKRGDNCMKVFTVWASKKPVASEEQLKAIISDDDLPPAEAYGV